MWFYFSFIRNGSVRRVFAVLLGSGFAMGRLFAFVLSRRSIVLFFQPGSSVCVDGLSWLGGWQIYLLLDHCTDINW